MKAPYPFPVLNEACPPPPLPGLLRKLAPTLRLIFKALPIHSYASATHTPLPSADVHLISINMYTKVGFGARVPIFGCQYDILYLPI